MIRLGAAVERLSVEQYGAYYCALYRMHRDRILREARSESGDERIDSIRYAIHLHRQVMRCLREARRDQLARGGI